MTKLTESQVLEIAEKCVKADAKMEMLDGILRTLIRLIKDRVDLYDTSPYQREAFETACKYLEAKDKNLAKVL